MSRFDPQQFGPAVAALLNEPRVPDLGPGQPAVATEPDLRELTCEDLFPSAEIIDRPMAMSCLAGLWLWFDFLDESHSISQDIETSTGSYWHGIMHRREGDYPNAKYWFRHVGRHPVFDQMGQWVTSGSSRESAEAFALMGHQGHWDPFRFVDLCQQNSASTSADAGTCRELALVEWQLLFAYCYTQALGA